MQNLKTINYLTCTEHSCTVHSLNLQIKIQSDQIKQLNYEEQNLRKIRKKWTNCYNKVQKKSKLCNQNYLKYILHWVVINMKIPTWNWKYKTYKDNWRHLIVLKVSRKTQNRDELKENIGSNQQVLIRSLTNGILSIHMLFPFIHSRLYPSIHVYLSISSFHPSIHFSVHPSIQYQVIPNLVNNVLLDNITQRNALFGVRFIAIWLATNVAHKM